VAGAAIARPFQTEAARLTRATLLTVSKVDSRTNSLPHNDFSFGASHLAPIAAEPQPNLC